MVLAWSRRVFVLLEQGQSSVLPKFPSVKLSLELIGAGRIHTWLRAFNHPMPKPTYLWSTMPATALSILEKKKPAGAVSDERYWHNTATGWWTGGPKLKSAEEFTQEFASAIVTALEAARTLARSDACI